MVGLVLLAVFISGSFHEIQAQAKPYLEVSRPVITETDTVTLDCQTPRTVNQCYFYTEGRDTNVFSCLKTLTGTQLLLMAGQSSPAEVKVTCFYTQRYGDVNSPSAHSKTSSITILKTLEIELHPMQTRPFPMTTGPPTSTPVTSIKGLTETTSRNTEEHIISSSTTPGKPEMRMWALVVAAVTAGFGVTVGVISLALALLCSTRRSGTEKPNREQPQNEESNIYYSIPEEPCVSAPPDMMYSTLQPV